MNERIKKILMWMGILVLLAIPIVASYHIGHRTGRNEAISGIKPDTLIVDHYDTIGVPYPVYFEKKVVDTMFVAVPVKDSTGKMDSIPIPREQAHYKDSLYEAWVSGYKPAMDSINIFRHDRTMYVTKTIETKLKPRWSLGVQAGYGAYLEGNVVHTTPYIGLGVTYNIFTW